MKYRIIYNGKVARVQRAPWWNLFIWQTFQDGFNSWSTLTPCPIDFATIEDASDWIRDRSDSGAFIEVA